MAGVGCRGLWLRVTVAFTLVLSAWVSSSTCLSLHGLGKTLQQTEVDEATVAGAQKGKILFDGKDLELQAEPSPAAALGKLAKIILGQSIPSEKLDKEHSTDKEAEWKHLKPSLHCGHSQMEFRATGHRAADIQLDIGADDPLPLNQVPKSCGYTMRKSALDFVLAVSYDGCNIIRENGIYVLKMRWLNASVEFICSVTSSSELHDQYEFQFQEPELPSVRSGRPRRQTTEQFYYNPCSLYPYYYYACLYYYYMYMMNLAHASQTQTATIAAPQVLTANPPGDGKQMPLYYYYFHPYYYQGGNVPVKVPQSSECDWTADAQQRPQCSNIPPGHVKWPFYPSSGPTQQGFPGSPLLPQVPQQHHGKYPQQKVPQLSSLKKPGKPHHPSKYKPSPTTTTAATVRTTPCPTQGPVTTTTPCPTQGPVTTTTPCPTQGPVTTTTPCPTQGPVTTTTPCPATTTPCPTQGPVTTTTPCPATTTPCPDQEGPITTTTTPCSDQEGSITSCDGVVSKYVPYQNLVFQPYVSYEGGRSAGGPQKIPEQSLDFTGRAHPPAFSGLEGHDPVLMPSLYQEGALVGNPWFYYYSFPYVE